MSLYNYFYNSILILMFVLISSVTHAQTKPLYLKSVAVSYLSWIEFMTLDNGTISDEAFANFYGTAISYEKEKYQNRRGTIGTASVMFGQAGGGGTQSGILYQKAYQPWFGVMAEYKYAYRLTPQTTIALGPTAMYRQVKWQLEPGILKVESGAQINLGALLDFRIRFTPSWELRQTFGTMAFKASTFWSLGVAYKY